MVVLTDLDVDTLKELDCRSQITHDFFTQLLMHRNLPRKLYERLSIGYPWGEWTRVARLIEDLAERDNFFENNLDYNNIYLFNLFYFFPKFAVSVDFNFYKKLLYLDFQDLKMILTNKSVSELLSGYIFDKLDFALELPILRNLLLILWSMSFHDIVDRNKEEAFLTQILPKIDNYPLYYRIFSFRLKSLLKTKDKNRDKVLVRKDGVRCALVIAGQIRHPKNNLFSIVEKLSENPNLDIREIFLASWDRVGGYSFVPVKFSRHLEYDIVEDIKKGNLSVEFLIEKAKSLEAFNDSVTTNFFEDKIRDIPIRVKFNKESDYPYNEMYNSQKMYFNNAFWVCTLGENYFLDNFDVIIKIRPDVFLERFDMNLQEIEFCDVFAETGWIFRDWGFGMGDQILLGKPKNIIPLLNVHKNILVSEIVSDLYPGSQGFTGHANLGIVSWLNDYSVKRIPDFKHNFVYPKNISRSDLGIV